MRLNRKTLMGTVAAIGLGGYAMGVATEAHAFDTVNWTWNQTIEENIEKNVTINIDIDPIGMIDDQIMQIQIGDLEATSYVTDVYNWKPLSEQVVDVYGYKKEYALTVNANFNYSVSGGGNTTNNTQTNESTTRYFDARLNGSLVTRGSETPPFFIGGVALVDAEASFPPLTGSVEADAVIGAIGAYATDGNASFDADLNGSLKTGVATDSKYANQYTYAHNGVGTGHLGLTANETNIVRFYGLAPKLQNALDELPKVESVATAVGNSISIETDTAVQEHSVQVVFDTNCSHVDDGAGEGPQQGCNPSFEEADFDLDADLNINNRFLGVDSGNNFHDVAILTTLAAGAGLIKKADISATSEVDNIWNATVDSVATAVGNVKSIDITTDRAQNGLVIGDISQVSVADISAYSSVGGGGNAVLECLSVGCGGGYGGIHLVNYQKYGELDRAIVKSTATAIGNAVNIKINSGQAPAVSD